MLACFRYVVLDHAQVCVMELNVYAPVTGGRCWRRYLRRRGSSGRQLVRLRNRPVQVPEEVIVRPRSLVVCSERQHDREFLLQEYHLYRYSVVVPDLLWMEFAIVSLNLHRPYRRTLSDGKFPVLLSIRIYCGGTCFGHCAPSLRWVCSTV